MPSFIEWLKIKADEQRQIDEVNFRQLAASGAMLVGSMLGSNNAAKAEPPKMSIPQTPGTEIAKSSLSDNLSELQFQNHLTLSTSDKNWIKDINNQLDKNIKNLHYKIQTSQFVMNGGTFSIVVRGMDQNKNELKVIPQNLWKVISEPDKQGVRTANLTVEIQLKDSSGRPVNAKNAFGN